MAPSSQAGNKGSNINCYEPSHSASFRRGEDVTVKWLIRPGCNIHTVVIKCWKETPDGGALQFVKPTRFGMISRRCPAEQGEFHWTVPLDFPPHNYLKVTVTDETDEENEDQSYKFSIEPGPARAPTQPHTLGSGNTLGSSGPSGMTRLGVPVPKLATPSPVCTIAVSCLVAFYA